MPGTPGAGRGGRCGADAPPPRPPLFWAESTQLRREPIVLTGAEGHHAATVRRLSAGERADVTDGAGSVAECVVADVRPGRTELTVISRRAELSPEPRIVVAQAIPKGDRGVIAVEIMTEVGADAVVPWQAERCVARWRGDRAVKSLARWRAAAREAAKQSRRAWFPEVTPAETTAGLARRVSAASLAILLDPDAVVALSAVRLPGSGDIVIVVGPEGGVSPAEADELRRAGVVGARFGPTVLRTSSAGAVAAALLLSSSGRWS